MIPVYPVKSIHNFTSDSGNNRTGKVFRDCVLVRAGTTVRDLVEMMPTDVRAAFCGAETVGAIQVRGRRRRTCPARPCPADTPARHLPCWTRGACSAHSPIPAGRSRRHHARQQHHCAQGVAERRQGRRRLALVHERISVYVIQFVQSQFMRTGLGCLCALRARIRAGCDRRRRCHSVQAHHTVLPCRPRRPAAPHSTAGLRRRHRPAAPPRATKRHGQRTRALRASRPHVHARACARTARFLVPGSARTLGGRARGGHRIRDATTGPRRDQLVQLGARFLVPLCAPPNQADVGHTRATVSNVPGRRGTRGPGGACPAFALHWPRNAQRTSGDAVARKTRIKINASSRSNQLAGATTVPPSSWLLRPSSLSLRVAAASSEASRV